MRAGFHKFFCSLLQAPAALSILLFVYGCAPQIEPFRFLELEPAPGLRVDFAGPLDQREVWFAGEVPLRYVLERDRYRLLLVNDPPSVLPGLTIALAPESEPGLQLLPAPGVEESSPDGNVCASYYVLPAGMELEFGWAADCEGDDYSRAIEFDVLDSQGAKLGQERLAFVLRRQGWYVLRDDL
jgi:hypothetical protein